jgi:hypothetical protein
VSDPIDIKALDEYLKGGSDISQRYRELGREDVPPELDRRVLEAARAAVAGDGAKRSRSWLRWSAPIALAASVVLVVTVVIESGVQNDAMLAPQSPAAERQNEVAAERSSAPERFDELRSGEYKLSQDRAPAVPPAEPQVVPIVPVTIALPEVSILPSSDSVSTAVAPLQESLAKAQAQPRAVMPVAPAPPVVESPAPQLAAEQPSYVRSVESVADRKEVGRAEAEADDSVDASEVSVAGSRNRRATGRTAGPRNTVSTATSGAALSSDARPADAEEQSDPQKWLEEIRGLRRAGKAVDADREWQLFRDAFPDFRVADDDLARKKP